MTSISPAVSKAAASTRTEQDVRRERARKTLLEAARKECLSEAALRDAMSSLDSAFAMKDMMDRLFGVVR